jgi:PhnB protein
MFPGGRFEGEWQGMSATHKPASYTSVSPYLVVDGAGRTIEFLTTVFDGVELRRFPDPAGKIMHAEVRIDDSIVMLADGGPSWPPIPSYVHVYVADVDATYRRALAAGATSVQEPVKKADEDKRGGVKDAGGTTWWIATKVE